MTDNSKIAELVKAAESALIVFAAFGMDNHPIADQLRRAIEISKEQSK